MLEKILNYLGIDSVHFVASIEVIEAGNIVESIDLTESNELKLHKKLETQEKRRRGRPKLTKEQKALAQFKRDAGKTKKFAIGEEPNKRVSFS